MNKLNRLAIAIAVIACSLTLSCITMAAFHSRPLFQTDGDTITVGRTYEKELNFTYDTPDFEPVVTKVERLDLKPTQPDGTTEYHAKMNNAVSLMRQKDYAAAIAVLEPMARDFKDEGLALYNLGVCHIEKKEYAAAMKYLANSHASGFTEAFRAIDNLHAAIGFEHFQKKEYGPAISYFKTAPANENVSMNVIYSYMELAKASPHPTNLMLLLYAGNYIVDNGVRDPNILGLGGEIARQLGDEPVKAYLPNAVAVLEYLVKATGNPWLHVNLGMLYAHSDRPDLARAQYALAADRSGSDKDARQFATGRLVEMGTAKFLYQKDLVLNVQSKSGSLKDADFEGTFEAPVSRFGQTASALAVFLNGRPIDFTTAADRYQTDLIRVKLAGLLQPGENRLTVQALVEKAPVRFSTDSLAGKKLSDYGQKAREYRLYTESSKIFNLSHPLVVKAAAEVRKKAKKNDLASTVKAVYGYVMEKMRYELYDNARRPKEAILDRLRQTEYSGLCEDYAVFTVAVLRTLGVPALVLSGPTLGSEIGHAWPAFFTPSYDKLIVVDTTWADTSQMPNYYYLFNTNQNVIDGVGWDSDVLPGAQSCTYRHSATIEVEVKSEKAVITLAKK